MTEQIQDLLEDFDIVGNPHSIALISMNRQWPEFHQNIEAAIMASTSRLKSIDYARKTYVKKEKAISHPNNIEREYINAYKSAKQYILRMISKLSCEGLPLPSNGVFGAALVLERLTVSFFSAHILYRLGLRYEGHAVSRLILEQIAWAHAAYELDEIDDIKKIETTKTISSLKKVIPRCGPLYGCLSKETHIDYDSHGEFLRVENGKNVILQSQHQFNEYAQVVLNLADMFGIVWELSQYKYLSDVEAIEVKNDNFTVKTNRPFIAVIETHLDNLDAVDNKKNNI